MKRFATTMLSLCVASGVAYACTKHSATEIAQAISNSPYSGPALKSQACAFGGAGMAESGGNTCASNGNNFGVLQLTNGNLPDGVTADEYLDMSLQEQVDIWVQNTNGNTGSGYRYLADIMKDGSTIGGQPVTPGMMMACYQFGPVICNNDVNSMKNGGSCKGKGVKATGGTLRKGTASLDGNGHSICSWGKVINNQVAKNEQACKKGICKPGQQNDGTIPGNIASPDEADTDENVDELPA